MPPWEVVGVPDMSAHIYNGANGMKHWITSVCTALYCYCWAQTSCYNSCKCLSSITIRKSEKRRYPWFLRYPKQIIASIR